MNHTPTNNDDNLERFFKRYLGAGQPIPPDGWNTPDDDVWQAVATQLAPAPSRRRRIAWLWITIGLLSIGLVTLSVVVWQLQCDLRHIKSQYAAERTVIGLSANGGNAVPPTLTPQLLTQASDGTPRSPLPASAADHLQRDHSPKGRAAQASPATPITADATSEWASPLRGHPLPAQLANELATLPPVQEATMLALSGKPTPALSTSIAHHQPQPHNYEVRRLKKSFAQSLTLDVDYYAPLLVNFASVQSPHLILQRGYAPWSWMQGVGAQLTYRIDHRMGVSVGAYRNELSKQFLAYSIDRYDAQKDVPTGTGGIQHTTAVSVNTPVGHIREQISFRRRAQDEPLTHNSTMVIEGVMLHNLQIHRVPIRFQYDLWQRNGLAITAGLGVVYNRVATDKYDVAYNVWVKDQVVSQHVYSVNLDSPMRRHIWDGTASMQVMQRIGNQLNIHLGTAYEHSLAPIYSDPAAVNRGRLQGLQVTMGVGYTFSPRPRGGLPDNAVM